MQSRHSYLLCRFARGYVPGQGAQEDAIRGGFDLETVADLDAEVCEELLGQDNAGALADLSDFEEGFHTAVIIGGSAER